MRIDTDRIPSSLLNAYTKIETDIRAPYQPERVSTKAQHARPRKPPRFGPRPSRSTAGSGALAHYPVLWEGRQNVLYAGTASTSVLDRLMHLFRETFDGPAPITPREPGVLLDRSAMARIRSAEDFAPLGFVGGIARPHRRPSPGRAATRRPGTSGERVPLWLWHSLQIVGRHDRAFRTDRRDRDDSPDLDLRLPPRRDRPRQPDQRRADTSPRSLPRPPGGKASSQGRPIVAGMVSSTSSRPGGEAGRLGGQIRRRPGSPHEVQIARIESLRTSWLRPSTSWYEAYGRRRTGPDWNTEFGRIEPAEGRLTSLLGHYVSHKKGSRFGPFKSDGLLPFDASISRP